MFERYNIVSDGDLRDAVTKLAARRGTFFGSGTKVGQPTAIGAAVARPIARFIEERLEAPPGFEPGVEVYSYVYLGTESVLDYPFRDRRAAGLTSLASFQKSRGRFASSGGAVLRISASVIARRCFKSARPRLGPSGWRAVIPRRLLLIANLVHNDYHI